MFIIVLTSRNEVALLSHTASSKTAPKATQKDAPKAENKEKKEKKKRTEQNVNFDDL